MSESTCMKNGACSAAPAVGTTNTLDNVKDYYGKVLQGTKDLKTNVCTVGAVRMPKHVREALGHIHEEVTKRYYGCGLVIPECLEGTSVLDLGSGAGQDCFVLSKLVGENGHVTGIDMTDEQVNVAKEYISYHTEKFGYSKPNVDFVQGYIEKLGESGLKDNSFDIIVSNCVVNLSPDKRAVLKEAYRVLKEGGEFYFSDLYADQDLPEEIRKHKVLWGECIAGALWWKDLVRLSEEIGFAKPRLVTANTFEIGNNDLQKIIGDSRFVSVTYRLFKLPEKRDEPTHVIYDGSVTGFEEELKLDYNHIFKRGEVTAVDGDIATIIKTSRFCDDFTFEPNSVKEKIDIQTLPVCDVDPFKYVDKAGEKGTVGGGCCGPKASKPCC